MINPSVIYRTMEQVLNIGRRGAAPSIKEDIKALQSMVDELKRDWRDLAAQEYAAERVFNENQKGLTAAGWTPGSFLKALRNGEFVNDDRISRPWFEYQRWFISTMPDLNTVFPTNQFKVW